MTLGYTIVASLLNKEFIKKLFFTAEGLILLLSVSIVISLAVFIISYYFIDANFANKATGIVFTNIFVGRVPALSLGYAAGLTHFEVIAFNVIAEMILVTLLYSLFVFSYKGILKVKALEKFFQKVEQKKEEHQETFDKYGRLGLFIFVFIPFWMTGPIVGSIIGFLIGMKHYMVILIVFFATIVSMTLWGLFLQEIIDFVVDFDVRILWGLIFIIILVVLFFKFRRRE